MGTTFHDCLVYIKTPVKNAQTSLPAFDFTVRILLMGSRVNWFKQDVLVRLKLHVVYLTSAVFQLRVCI